MTPRDYDNLRFLLTISTEDLTAWYEQASPADAAYASSLFTIAHLEFIDFAVDLLDEFPDAEDVINKIKVI